MQVTSSRESYIRLVIQRKMLWKQDVKKANVVLHVSEDVIGTSMMPGCLLQALKFWLVIMFWMKFRICQFLQWMLVVVFRMFAN